MGSITTERLERDLELAEATRREIMRPLPNRDDVGWTANRRANIYAVDAEIRRLREALGWTSTRWEGDKN